MSNVRLTQHNGYIFFVRTAMTPAQIRAVRASYQMLSQRSDEASRIFYDELFSIRPELKDLFPEHMKQQREKFVQMLSVIINSLNNISQISEYISDLGRRHALYEVEDAHYDIVGEAFLSMLRRLLEERFTPELQDAWAAVYDMAARMMKEASSGPYTADVFFASVIRSVITSQYGVSLAQQKNVAGKAPITHAIDRGEVVNLT